MQSWKGSVCIAFLTCATARAQLPPLPKQPPLAGGLGANSPLSGFGGGGVGANPPLGGGLAGGIGGGTGLGGAPPLGGGGGLAGGLGGLGAAPPLGGGLGGGLAGGLAGAAAGGNPPELPTLNLLGGGLRPGGGLGATGLQGADNTPSEVQQMQEKAVQSRDVDTMCPGKQRKSTDVGSECWMKIWTAGGCKAENLPPYESWHQAQSLEVLVADVVQWANLPDERHQKGCYGSDGPPANLPLPPQAGLPQGGLSQNRPLQGGPLGGLPGFGQQRAAPSQPDTPPEVLQAIQATLENPSIGNVCPGVGQQATDVGEACWKALWKHVGCLESAVPEYGEWHRSQNFQVLAADAATWASSQSPQHRNQCYGPGVGARREL
mmetsp:Transcript_21123/g.38568  ORF Transcript_21123/g.38568 Transcript_21123/m.38568 type:complete len:377 (-) Transcript_21123:53-1183(-)